MKDEKGSWIGKGILQGERGSDFVDYCVRWSCFVHMKKVTLRKLMRNAEKIRITERGATIAILKGLGNSLGTSDGKPDFAARRQAIWGQRIFTTAEVAAMRADELEGEEG